jgi:hypothetical protein
METETPVRAPRLTENRLADLDEVVLVLDVEVAFLAESVTFWPATHKLHTRLKYKQAALQRARDWIAGKVAAERSQRGDSA